MVMFDFDDLERTLPVVQSRQRGVDDASETPASLGRENEKEYAKMMDFFAELRGPQCRGTFAEGTTWKSLDRDMWVACRGLLRPQDEMEEIQARRVNTARLEQWSKFSQRPDPYLVTVICPTTARRRHFHGLLHECFQRQNYDMKELVVIETSEGEPSQFWLAKAREHPSIFYRHYAVPEESWPIGLKRNLACCFASGSIIAHFDDDDLYAPNYLTTMVRQLVDAPSDQTVQGSPAGPAPSDAEVSRSLGPFGAGCAKLSSWLKFSVPFTMWFACNPSQDERMENARDLEHCLYGWGFSFVYLRSAWLMCPFPHIQLGEDFKFMQGLRNLGFPVVLVKGFSKICCHTQHGRNTSGQLMELSEPLTMADQVLKASPLAPLLDRYRQTVDTFCPDRPKH